MHMALDHQAWLKLHTSYCTRLQSWISHKSCDANRERSSSRSGDCRCFGCGGLDNQAQSPVPLNSTLSEILEEVLTEDTKTRTTAYHESALTDHDPDEIHAQLMQLFPDLSVLEPSETTDDAADQERQGRRTKRGYTRRKYAVYKGRCRRCGGYMTNDIEWHDGTKDDEIYRCFTCGWRTSPEYTWNRAKGV